MNHSHPAVDVSWWRTAVVYQVYPRSFSDSNADGIGDIEGLRSRLPYLADLGIDAIWLSPFYPSPLADGGYDIVDYRDVDSRLGCLADFDRGLPPMPTSAPNTMKPSLPTRATVSPLRTVASMWPAETRRCRTEWVSRVSSGNPTTKDQFYGNPRQAHAAPGK